MDDIEFPTNDRHLSLHDGFHTSLHEERTKTCLASSPDENENQFNSRKHDTLTSSQNTMGKVDQDSINNNEDRGDCTFFCQEDESANPCRNFTEISHVLERFASEKNSPGKTKSSNWKTKQEKTDITADSYTQDEDGNQIYSNCPPDELTQTLQVLFSLTQGEFEQMDLRILPLCLHQIAETYFQDGEYEKAMKFIHLEQLYHKQLLTNLSSIQQQWERKWKTIECSKDSNLKNSAKGLNKEELDKLTKFCLSHQEPLVSRRKLINKEISFKCEKFIGLMVSEDLKERGAPTCDSDTLNLPVIKPKKENHHKEREGGESFQPERCCLLTEKEKLQLTVKKHPMEEELCSTESLLNQPFDLSTETLDTPCSGCLSFKDAHEDARLQLREEQFPPDGTAIGAITEKLAAECSSEPMVDTLVLTDADLICTDENIPSGRNFLRSNHCSHSVIYSSQLESSIFSQTQQQEPQPDDEKNRKAVQNRTSDISGNVHHDEHKRPKPPSVVYEWIQEETTVVEEECEGEEPEGFFDQFINGSIKIRKGALKFLETEESSEILPHILPEQAALYSSSEDYPPNESFSSLDELAKRIEIAETVPAEGLVSILKKRNDSEGNTLAQIQQRQSKRRVRFQEMEETLEQEEVGAGSCILLILLCIATVFLSIGGTALYCTFGNEKSQVCTDFAANVEFYYSRVLQGIEELKHWIPL